MAKPWIAHVLQEWKDRPGSCQGSIVCQDQIQFDQKIADASSHQVVSSRLVGLQIRYITRIWDGQARSAQIR